jgi:hypothetical protein
VVAAVLSDASSVYRRLWRRSVVVAGLVFVVVALGEALASSHPTAGTLLVSLVLTLIGSLLVQGALVDVVRDLHEGRPLAPPAAYYERNRARLGTLLGVTVLLGVGVGIGFLFLVVPGLILLSRWSLVVPLTVIEGAGVRSAFSRSAELVRGRTGRVLVVVVVAGLVAAVANSGITTAFDFLPTFWAAWIGGTAAGAVAVPFEAHVLTVLYYKLTEPERPVLPDVPPT